MWAYRTNFMGPTGLWWYEENNIPFEILVINNQFTDYRDKEYKHYLEQYYGGRIDCYCSNPHDPDYDHYNRELSLPIMNGENYRQFSDWLDTFKSVSFVDSFEKLKEYYEFEMNTELILF